MSAFEPAYPLGNDAYQLLRLGIPPDQAVRIAAQMRANARQMRGEQNEDSDSGDTSATSEPIPPIFPTRNPFDVRKENLRAITATPQWRAFAYLIGNTEKADYGSVNNGRSYNRSFDPYTQPWPGRGAGLFQITPKLYPTLSRQLGIDSSAPFDPETQNIMAAQAVSNDHALQDVLNGDIAAAVPKIYKTWASLPGGPAIGGNYRQPYTPFKDVLDTYNSALNFYANEGRYTYNPQTRQLQIHQDREP